MVVILLFKEALAVPRALALFANVCSDSCNQQGRRPLWGLCAGKDLMVVGGVGGCGGEGLPLELQPPAIRKAPFMELLGSPHQKHSTSYLGVLVGVFPWRRAVHTLVEYRRRGNSFNLVPSHIQMSNSEIEVVVFLSVN